MTEPEVKDVGLVYKIITDGISQYFGHYTRLYKYDALRKFYVSEAKKAYADRGDAFPAEFFEAMADAVLRWAWDGFENIVQRDARPLFQKLWKLHRKYLLVNVLNDGEDVTLDTALTECNNFVSDSPFKPYTKLMVVAILRNIEADYGKRSAKDDTAEDIA